MKNLMTMCYAVLIVVITSASSQAVAQILLLDSLHGTWSMQEQYNDKIRVEPKGTIEFREDGTFVSNGSYFGSANGLYRTNETKSTIHIEINGVTSEWSASIRNHVLRMTRVQKKKTPRIELVLVSRQTENNNGN